MNDVNEANDAGPETESSAPAAVPETLAAEGVNHEHLRLLEAVLFASAEPMGEKSIAQRMPDEADLKGLLKALQEEYAGRGVTLAHSGQSWAFRTASDLGPQLNIQKQIARKLTRAGIETLAIVAYHQPVTRAEIEEIRGVTISKGTIDVLLEAGWVKPRGRRQTPGLPMQWGTTDAFLDHFGLTGLDDLPGLDELKAAGLLDASPARNVYAVHGNLGKSDPTSDGDDAPSGLADAGDQNEVEPLDPEEEPASASPEHRS